MEDNFQISGTNLTIRLPAEVDHHNSEELKRKADRMLMENNIRCIILILDEPILWTVPVLA